MSADTSTLQALKPETIPLASLGKCMLALVVTLVLAYLSALPAQAFIGNHLLIQGNIHSFTLTPDGQNVVVWADGVVSTTIPSLFRVRVDGSAPPQPLNGDLRVARFWGISPDGRAALFQDGDSDSGMYDVLYNVPVHGGAPSILNASLPDNALITDVRISPDSRHVALQVMEGESLSANGLYVVPIQGGNAVRLASSPYLTSFGFSPDGSHLLYVLRTGEKPEETRYALNIVPVEGGPALTLHTTAASFSAIINFSFSPDGKSVLYAADETVDNLWEVYQVPSTGGTPTNLSHPAFLAWPVAYPNGYAVTPDNATVLIRATRTLDHPYELYSIPITGGTLTPLAPQAASQTIVPYWQWNHVISPDSQWVTYAAQAGDYGITGLYRVDVAGGDARQLNQLANGATLSSPYGEYYATPDGRYLIFRALRDNIGPDSLYSVATAGGHPVLLGDGIANLVNWPHRSPISADSRWVFFQGSTNDGCCALLRAPAAGGAAQRMDGGLASAFDITPLPTSGQVLFRNSDALYASYELTATTYLPTVNWTLAGQGTDH